MSERELKPRGKTIPVTDENKMEYVQYVKRLLLFISLFVPINFSIAVNDFFSFNTNYFNHAFIPTLMHIWFALR